MHRSTLDRVFNFSVKLSKTHSEGLWLSEAGKPGNAEFLPSLKMKRVVEMSGLALLCLLSLGFLLLDSAGAEGAESQSQLPNLQVEPPADIRIGASDSGDEEVLRFSTTVTNAGRWPLDLLSEVPDPNTRTARAHQCINWQSPACTRRHLVGKFSWHAAHDHYHLADFLRYELRPISSSIRSNDRETRKKVSYCLSDTSPSRSRDEQGPDLGNPLYYCGLGVGWQGISPGWTDTYSSEFQGQELDLPTGVGRFEVRITVNPHGDILETSRRDNASYVLFQITKQRKLQIICAGEGEYTRCPP